MNNINTQRSIPSGNRWLLYQVAVNTTLQILQEQISVIHVRSTATSLLQRPDKATTCFLFQIMLSFTE